MKQSRLEKMIFSKYGNPNGCTLITKLGTEYESHYLDKFNQLEQAFNN